MQITATPIVVSATPEPQTVPATPEGVTGTVEVIESHIGAEIDPRSGELVEPRSVFMPQETVFLQLKLHNGSAAQRTGRTVWIDPRGGVAFLGELSVASGQTNRMVQGVPPPGGWLTGEHRIELYIENALVETWSFEIEAECEVCQEEQARSSIFGAGS